MKGVKKVIDALNKALANEIVAANQYFLQAKINEHCGLMVLADRLRKESLDEMKHAEILIERILHLEGVPQLQMEASPSVGETVTQQLQSNLALELSAVQALNDAITVARSKKDNTSAALLEKILGHEERHIASTEAKLGLIEKLGENAFLLTQIHGPITGAAGTAEALAGHGAAKASV